MTEPLRVAIVGAGMIAAVHRRAALLAGAQVTGVLASGPARSAEVARDWGVEAYADLDAVLADRPDVVHLCTPNRLHVPQAVAAMRAGIHVICEKPLGLDSTEAREAVTVATETGVVNTMPFTYRFHPMARELVARVQDEATFGTPYLIHGSYLQDWLLDPRSTSWRVDPAQGGAARAFGDIGSHWCDLAEWATGDRIATLTATTSISIPRRPASGGPTFGGFAGDDVPLVDVTTEDSALLLFRTVGGVAGSVTISQLAAGRKNRLWLEVDGARRSAVFDGEHAEQLWVGSDDGATVLVRDPQHGSAEERRLSTLPAGHAQGYAQCIEAFVTDSYAAVRAHGGDGEVPFGLPTFADGLRAALICDAVLESARTGAWVEVPRD